MHRLIAYGHEQFVLKFWVKIDTVLVIVQVKWKAGVKSWRFSTNILLSFDKQLCCCREAARCFVFVSS